MIYFQIAIIAATAIGLLIYTLLFDRKIFFPLLVVEVICAGFLSFYVFYYIGSYSSTDNDVQLNTNFYNIGSGLYSLIIDVEWKQKPEVFGFDGKDDGLIIRYNPQFFELVSSDRSYKQTELGKSTVNLSDDYKYSSITKNEREACFDVKDGESISTRVDLREIEPGGRVKVFFLHDYKIPLGSSVYWEKNEIVEFK